MKKIWWLASFALALTAQADSGNIRDPQGLLAQLDGYLGNPTFAQSFAAGDVAEFRRLARNCQIDCGDDGCGSACETIDEPMTLQVASLDATSVLLSLDDGSTRSLTADRFGEIKGDLVREEAERFFAETALPGYLEASELLDKQVKLPSGETLSGKELVFVYHVMPQDHQFKVRYTVSRTYPGVGQIIQMAAMGQWYYRITGMKRK